MNNKTKRLAALALALTMLLSLAACGDTNTDNTDPNPPVQSNTGSSSEPQNPSEPAQQPVETNDDDVDGQLILDHEEELQYATMFTLTHYKGGYKIFTIPETMGDNQYLLVPEGKSVPAGLPENTVVLQQPLTRVASASTAMISLVDASGGLDSIVAVATEQSKWYLKNVSAKMEAGDIQYFGSYSEPDFELLMGLDVQLEIDSTMLSGKPEIQAKYAELGIPCVIECSAQEEHVLGRMEWVKLYGAILECEEAANTYFDAQVEKVKEVSKLEKTGKTAAMYYVSKDTYYFRNKEDYCVSMLELAGGEYISQDIGVGEGGGNTKMTFEEFYATCKDADYLFYVVLTCPYASLEEMVAANPLYADFKAVQDGHVYCTVPGFSQSMANLANVVVEINSVLNDPSIESTDNLLKLQ